MEHGRACAMLAPPSPSHSHAFRFLLHARYARTRVSPRCFFLFFCFFSLSPAKYIFPGAFRSCWRNSQWRGGQAGEQRRRKFLRQIRKKFSNPPTTYRSIRTYVRLYMCVCVSFAFSSSLPLSPLFLSLCLSRYIDTYTISKRNKFPFYTVTYRLFKRKLKAENGIIIVVGHEGNLSVFSRKNRFLCSVQPLPPTHSAPPPSSLFPVSSTGSFLSLLYEFSRQLYLKSVAI